MSKILLLEDLPHIRAIIKDLLEYSGHEVDEAPDLKTAARKLDLERYDVVVMDLKLPDGDCISLFDRYAEKLESKSIIITANATVSSVVEAIKKGAFNYLEKPVDEDMLMAQVNNILGLNSLKEGNKRLVDEVSSNFTFESIIYESKAMEGVIARAKVLAQTNNTILIYGETGCGKEVLSHSIHNGSPRKNEIFMPVNCASIPSELFESELFGFEKGAFTGAVGNYSGRFVQSDKGTLFLDEIGELPLHIQAKLLRVLDDRSIFPLKGLKPIDIDVRLITATNRDLGQEVKLKQFRSDLYYRLKESSIVIPPLRERVEDILPLIRHFIKVYNHVYNKAVTRLTAEVEKFFLTYAWGGNVRELKNIIKSTIPFKSDHVIRMEDLSYSLMEGGLTRDTRGLTLAEGERKRVHTVLKLAQFNIR
ncbi:MAG: sigma-54-dependent Fis family transcriptional regulator, partial [bacterium]|nr:sigma-54-dependent Fis family transcriptional regulator [bacterium]